MGATRQTHRECCNYCMWFGPVNQDGTMRKHRPATSEDRFGRKVQNRHEDHCQGSHKPYARFGCETEETTVVSDPQPTTTRYITHSFQAGPHTVFAVKDTVTQIDVASSYSRYAARDKRDRLNAGLTATENRETQLAQEFPTEGSKCGHGFALRAGVTSSVKCEFGHEYGVFGDEGPIDRSDCAMQAANDAAFYAAEDDGDTQYVVKVICPDHEDQAKDTCEECNAEGDE